MRKIICLFLILTTVAMLAACEKKTRRTTSATDTSSSDYTDQTTTSGQTTEPDATVFDTLGRTQEATAVVLRSEISAGDEVLALSVSSYDMVQGSVSIYTRVRNTAEAAALYTEKTETRSFDRSGTLFEISPEDITGGFTELNGAFACGSVAHGDVSRVFGIDSASVDGDISVALTAEAGRPVSAVLEYTTANGNTARITFTFEY